MTQALYLYVFLKKFSNTFIILISFTNTIILLLFCVWKVIIDNVSVVSLCVNDIYFENMTIGKSVILLIKLFVFSKF